MRKTYQTVARLLGVLLCAAVVLVPYGDAVLAQDGERIDTETLELIARIRGETAAFRDIDVAMNAGYSPFLDCLSDEIEGGMGQHYVNAELVGDGAIDPLRPEALVYEPGEDGNLVLVAVEYVLPLEPFTEPNPPWLFGQQFHRNVKIPEAQPAWILHLWVGTHNPNSVFADYNNTVFCPRDTAFQS